MRSSSDCSSAVSPASPGCSTRWHHVTCRANPEGVRVAGVLEQHTHRQPGEARGIVRQHAVAPRVLQQTGGAKECSQRHAAWRLQLHVV